MTGPIVEIGEAEQLLGIDLRGPESQPPPAGPAERDTAAGHRHHQLGVVPGHRQVAVAERLHQADLAALHRPWSAGPQYSEP